MGQFVLAFLLRSHGDYFPEASAFQLLEVNMKYLMLLATVLLLPACASQQAETKVNEELKQEPGVFNQAEIAEKSHEIILNHPSLTDKQRGEMRELFAEVYRKNIVLRSEIGKLKGVFFKTLFSRDRKEAEMKVLKKRLLAANEKKMELMLNALDSANKILGKDGNPQQFERLFRELDRIHAYDGINK